MRFIDDGPWNLRVAYENRRSHNLGRQTIRGNAPNPRRLWRCSARPIRRWSILRQCPHRSGPMRLRPYKRARYRQGPYSSEQAMPKMRRKPSYLRPTRLPCDLPTATSSPTTRNLTLSTFEGYCAANCSLARPKLSTSPV